MRQVLFTVVFCFCLCKVSAQDIATVFINMPDQHIPQLEDAWRKDLVDLYQSGKEARLKNTMNGESILREMTKDYLLLRSTERTTVELKLLPLVNNTHIVCMITTVEGPVADSKVEFYTTAWQQLEAAELYTPVEMEWFLKKEINRNSEDYKHAVSRLDMHLFKYRLSANDLTMTATYMTPEYLSKEDRDKVSSFLKDLPKVYTWTKSRFE